MIARLMKNEARALVIWAVVIAAALIFLWASRGTDDHQLAVGLLLSSISLFILMALLELLLHIFADRPA